VNILITNDDGPEAHGLGVLKRAVKAVYPEARIVTLTPRLGQGGQGLAITPLTAEALPVEQIEPGFFVCDGKPADLIYVGLGLPQLFLPEGQFDLVLTGVNHGHNVGMDVFHSGDIHPIPLFQSIWPEYQRSHHPLCFSHNLPERIKISEKVLWTAKRGTVSPWISCAPSPCHVTADS